MTDFPTSSPTLALGEFAAGLTYEKLPEPVKVALADLLLDWLRVASVGERMEWSGWSRGYIAADGGQGNAGILFNPMDERDIANKILMYLRNEKLLEEKSFFLKDSIFAYNMNRKSSIDIDEEIDFKIASQYIKCN